MDVISIGALNLDFIYEIEDLSYLQTLELHIEEGKEIVGQTKSFLCLREKLNRFGTLSKVSLGGSASNTGHVLSRLGFRTGLMGVLGEDKEGDFYLRQILYENTDLIIRRGETGVAYIINTAKKDRSIIVFPNSNSEIRLSDINFNVLSRVRLIHMTSLVSENAFEVQKSIKRELSGTVLFSLDPGEIYARMGEKLHPLIEGVEILFTTEKEMELIFGTDEESARKKALEMAAMLVVKKGKNGASLYTKGLACDVSADEVEAVDNTGAGDVLNGVFLALYLQKVDPSVALLVAVKAASMSVTGYGRDTYPSKQAIEAMMNIK
jgi:ribokinase